MPSEPCLSAALSYLRRGWSPLPEHVVMPDGVCSCSRVHCDKPGKHPRGSWAEYQRRPATAEVVRLWYKRWPDANVGIATGVVSQLVVLDVDPRHGGSESLADLGPLPPTPTVLTGGGGQHLYFRHPGGTVPNRTGFLPGLDLRGDGGQVVAPPSLHESGRRYEWEPGYSPDDVPLADMPEALLRLVLEHAPVFGQEPNGNRGDLDAYALGEGVIPEGERNTTLTRLAGRWFGEGDQPDKVLRQLLFVNQACCQPPLSREEVQAILRSIHQREQRRAAAVAVVTQPLSAQQLEDMPVADRLQLAQAAWAELGVEGVTDWVCLVTPEGSEYQIEFPDRVVVLGESMLTGYRAIRAALERQAQMPAMKQDKWEPWGYKLAQLAREVQVGFTKPSDEVEEWTEEYAQLAVESEVELRAEHLRAHPIWYGDRIATRTARMLRWVEVQFGVRLTAGQLRRRLEAAGWKYTQIRVSEDSHMRVLLSPELRRASS